MSDRNFGLVINQAQAATVDGAWMELGPGLTGLSIQTEFGAVTGTLALQSRNDANLTGRDVTDVVFTQPAGVSGGQVIEVGNARSRWYRVKYTHGSGTGSLKVAVFAKGV